VNKKDIEKLVLWLVIALFISTVFGQFLQSYMQSFIKNSSQFGLSSSWIPPFGMSHVDFLNYGIILVKVLSYATNVVIASWLFKISESKKYLWLALGFLASWWALAVFAYYKYHLNQSDNINELVTDNKE